MAAEGMRSEKNPGYCQNCSEPGQQPADRRLDSLQLDLRAEATWRSSSSGQQSTI